MELECSMQVEGQITLVSLVVTNHHDEAARFRLENRLDGPVWPPRRGGQPEAGWDGAGYEGVLEPGEERVLGYATPADPRSPPTELARVEPVAHTGQPPGSSEVLRRFADSRPPRSVLSPTPSISRGERTHIETQWSGRGGWP